MRTHCIPTSSRQFKMKTFQKQSCSIQTKSIFVYQRLIPDLVNMDHLCIANEGTQFKRMIICGPYMEHHICGKTSGKTYIAHVRHPKHKYHLRLSKVNLIIFTQGCNGARLSRKVDTGATFGHVWPAISKAILSFTMDTVMQGHIWPRKFSDWVASIASRSVRSSAFQSQTFGILASWRISERHLRSVEAYRDYIQIKEYICASQNVIVFTVTTSYSRSGICKQISPRTPKKLLQKSRDSNKYSANALSTYN